MRFSRSLRQFVAHSTKFIVANLSHNLGTLLNDDKVLRKNNTYNIVAFWVKINIIEEKSTVKQVTNCPLQAEL